MEGTSSSGLRQVAMKEKTLGQDKKAAGKFKMLADVDGRSLKTGANLTLIDTNRTIEVMHIIYNATHNNT